MKHAFTAKNKFNAKKTIVDGIKFDSQAEARRWRDLVLLQKSFIIKDLERQVRIDFIINGKKCGFTKIDFGYVMTSDDRKVLEDVKGYIGSGAATQLWKLKYKLVEALTGIPVEIVK